MENCFQDIIGIKGQCGELETPSSGLYVQDLPFMNMKTFDSLIEDQNSSIDYIQDKLRYAVNLVKNELNTKLLPYYKQNSALEQSVIGQYIEQMQAITGAATYRGIQIKLDKKPFLGVSFTNIALYSSNYSGAVTIKVWDLITGAELDSFPITITAGGINYIKIDKTYFTNMQKFNIFVGYDATGINSFQTNVYRGQSDCNSCYPGRGYGTKYAILNAGEIGLAMAKLEQNINYTNYTGGLSVMYNIHCNKDQFLCSIKGLLAFPILHKFGVVICDEILNGSKRVNSVTTIDREKAEALKADFEMVYNTGIMDVLSNLRFPNDTCFRCNQRIKVISRIP